MNAPTEKNTALTDLAIYQYSHSDKQTILAEKLLALTNYHREHCLLYARFINAHYPNLAINHINDIPPFAARHFKEYLLASIAEKDIFRTLHSSGTSGQNSQIVLDAQTAQLQSTTLVKILQHWLGKARRPMLIIDTSATLKQPNAMTARAAGIRGFAMFGRDHCYALNEDLSLNTQAVVDFFDKYQQTPVLIFGFTYIVWQYFIDVLKQKNITAQFSHASLFHGGGWKKLQAQAVSNKVFKAQITQQLGQVSIHDYYGMVEQTGTIHIECEHGYLHTPIWADVITRRASDLTIADHGEQGLIQVNSIIAQSYPGHALLTEDLGIIIGEDTCPCGRKGKYFHVHGRVPKAQIRGCSDTLPSTSNNTDININHANTLDSVDNPQWHIKAAEQKANLPVPWHSALIDEVSLFSTFLLNNRQSKQQPELVALAFWCRKANLEKIKQDYISLSPDNKRHAIGNVFHIAPANVDTVFFYSLLLSVLSGNTNVVRISERSGDICRLLITLLKTFIAKNNSPLFSQMISIVEYNANNVTLTKSLSQWSDFRIIWGGDLAIETINKIAPVEQQVCFPTRFSIAVMHLVAADDLNNLAKQFIADFLPFHQQACSSPKALFWLNTNTAIQQQFKNELISQLEQHQQKFTLTEQSERQINLQELLLENDKSIVSNHSHKQIATIEFDTITPVLIANHNGNGLLLMQNISDLSELPFDEKLQTVSTYGICENELLALNNKQCKRVVNLGQALTFNHLWDGINLLEKMTKHS
tara:strand:- start:4877 stop:7153 length:2277 start_codon:yes stop_codon:yes gene_type:complete